MPTREVVFALAGRNNASGGLTWPGDMCANFFWQLRQLGEAKTHPSGWYTHCGVVMSTRGISGHIAYTTSSMKGVAVLGMCRYQMGSSVEPSLELEAALAWTASAAAHKATHATIDETTQRVVRDRRLEDAVGASTMSGERSETSPAAVEPGTAIARAGMEPSARRTVDWYAS
jgi:hypothetical protein